MVPQPIAGPRQQAWFRALDRARLMDTKPCYRPASDDYRVTSPRAGDVYYITRVEVDGRLTYTCTCQAGQRGMVCWHKALIAALPGECSLRRRYKAQGGAL